MTVVIGTAGHIDHGKTTLLRALTGIDADRLPEERRRGMTIDVGYAHLALADGTVLDFVDVPGHDKLVGNMLVGAGEVDAAMLVVAADDGPRAQTLEHLEILDALGIADGLAVVTKADTVDPARTAEVAAAIAGLLARTGLSGAPVIVVSAVSGDGLAQLRDELIALRDRVLARVPVGAGGRPRLAIDRVFAVKGRGTVVTGSLRGGRLERGTTMRVEPGGGSIRAREIQVHGGPVDPAEPGRTAINLGGGDGAQIARGSVLTTDPSVVASDRLLVALRPSAGLGGSVRRLPADRSTVLVHLGTAHVSAVVARSGRDDVTLTGGEVAAILRLTEPVGVAPGDRFVVRRPSPAQNLAGGRVLDAAPPRGISRRRATPERLAALAAAPPDEATWQAARLDLHGALVEPGELAPDVRTRLGESIVAAVANRDGVPLAALRTGAARALRRLVTIGPRPSELIDREIDRLVADGQLERVADRVGVPGRSAATPGPDPGLVAAMTRLEAALDTLAPPALSAAARATGCPPDGIRALESSGRIVRLDDDLAYAAATYRSIERRALELAADGPMTPATFRDATGTSRKYVMAILEDLGRRGILQRTPAGHVPGPRAALEVTR